MPTRAECFGSCLFILEGSIGLQLGDGRSLWRQSPPRQDRGPPIKFALHELPRRDVRSKRVRVFEEIEMISDVVIDFLAPEPRRNRSVHFCGIGVEVQNAPAILNGCHVHRQCAPLVGDQADAATRGVRSRDAELIQGFGI